MANGNQNIICMGFHNNWCLTTDFKAKAAYSQNKIDEDGKIKIGEDCCVCILLSTGCFTGAIRTFHIIEHIHITEFKSYDNYLRIKTSNRA